MILQEKHFVENKFKSHALSRSGKENEENLFKEVILIIFLFLLLVLPHTYIELLLLRITTYFFFLSLLLFPFPSNALSLYLDAKATTALSSKNV